MRTFYFFFSHLYTGFRHNKWQIACYLLLLTLLPQFIWAEGSKELNSNGGGRAYLSSSTTQTTSFPFPTLGTTKVYVKAGEILNIGSSAQGINLGTINLRAPDGTTYTSGTSTTIGLIANHAQELAGALPNAGGYKPYTRTVTSAQEGIWEIDFIAPGNDGSVESAPVAIPASADWSQPSGPYIAAFDITVRTATNVTVPGRVFTNIFCGILSTFNVGFNGIFHILTKDGYQYTLDNNGQAGNGFSFFVNNKGFRTGSGAPSYKSLNSIGSPVIQDPRDTDTQSDITHKIFFNTPAADLPATAKTPGGGSTWLINAPFVPSVSQIKFTGTEGTEGKTGTSPLGGTFSFNSTSTGTYTLTIDANNNGILTDAVDRKLTGVAIIGTNSISWDGLDGAGNKLSAGNATFNANLSLLLHSAEVHFPFFDVERNVNGIKLTRTTNPTADGNNVYWDDSDITLSGTPSSPITNLTGISSLTNGHKWGATTVTNSDSDFGDNKSIDTWAYVTSAPINAPITFAVREADLEVVSLNSDISTGCIGQTVSYTAVVKNNGPSDVTGAAFGFYYPAELSNVKVTSQTTTGTTVLVSDTTDAKFNNYTAQVNMTNGSTRTFTLTGVVTKAPSGKFIVDATILRPADVTDPDATNPNSVIPTNPFDECDSAPSGVGCNNIKVDSTATFLPQPSAGADQTVEKNTIATITANQTGTWAQIGVLPVIANINAPASEKTTISGLTEIGAYKFVFTNANSCADTVTVNVTSKELSPPKVVTPNGDGKNDTFIVPDIGLYPGSTVDIYNRWGNEVFHSNHYSNNWAGQGLADGTYFYLINRKEANGTFTLFKGWIYLKH
ncbi:gliding motility-associated C-terminal domain-containing protein [Mucilaginibacter sp. dw_454]|uniref:T9SS type B sorting domain-containing protein n=1 Tax=Mucilaginibacter sp. dw_454 TaxID=2720079 RepID=UPI001BD6D15A|nr:gliding motility-associated C-terminal domain-containing protein [Mucilaginibacter sp. dw_454]